MKSPESINIWELEYQIDKRLNNIQKRKIQPIKASVKSKNANNVMQQFKWNIITRHLQKLQKANKQHFKIVKPPRKNEDLFDIVNRIMLLQKSLIELSSNINNYRRLPMLLIFFHCALAIIFNAYNLVVFLLKLANQTGDVPLSLAMLLFFYGYHITSSMINILFSVVAYSGVFNSIRNTASSMDELNMYIFDGVINARISQSSTYVFNNLRTFTLYNLCDVDGSLLASILSVSTTYIIILIQYSGDGEICKTAVDLYMNETQHHS